MAGAGGSVFSLIIMLSIYKHHHHHILVRKESPVLPYTFIYLWGITEWVDNAHTHYQAVMYKVAESEGGREGSETYLLTPTLPQ